MRQNNFDYENYYELDYIQGDGSSYINSGLKTNRDTLIEGKFQNGTGGYFFGLAQDATRFFDFLAGNNGTVYRFRLVSSTAYELSPVFSNPFTAHICARGGSGAISLTDGVTTLSQSMSQSSTATTTRNLYIMARNNEGSVSTYGDHKIFYLNIGTYGSDDYVHKFIPAMRKSDNAVGLYDTVTESFYGNAGNGTFSYGKIVNYNKLRIKINGDWIEGTPFIKADGEWKEGTPYIKTNGEWKEGI